MSARTMLRCRRIVLAVGSVVLLLVGGCAPVPIDSPPIPSPTAASSMANPSTAPSETSPPKATGAVSSPCGQAVNVSEPHGTSPSSRAAFNSPPGIAIYDAASDTTQLFGDGSPPYWALPRFRTPMLVSFVRSRAPADDDHVGGRDAVYEVDLSDGGVVEVLRLEDSDQQLAWSPAGTSLAYLLRVDTASAIGPRRLCLYDSRRGTTALLHSIENPFGTGAGQLDETRVSWSRQGKYIATVETAATPSLFVVDAAGDEAIDPIRATFARWLSGSRLLFRQESDDNPDSSWFTVELDSGRTQ